MANFTFLDPTGSNLSGNRILPSLGVTTMRITRDKFHGSIPTIQKKL